MNKETLKALSRVMACLDRNEDIKIKRQDMEQVQAWIDEQEIE